MYILLPIFISLVQYSYAFEFIAPSWEVLTDVFLKENASDWNKCEQHLDELFSSVVRMEFWAMQS